MNEVNNETLDKKPYEYLKEYMDKEKLTQGAIGELLGTNQCSISLILKDKKVIKEEWALKLAARFSCEKELFFKPKTKVKNGEVVTSVSVGNDAVVAQEKPILTKEKLKAKEVPVDSSEVAISFGLTKSLGNFEFFRCDVYAKDFCAIDQKQKTWDLLEKEVSERLEKVLNNMDKYRSAPVGSVTFIKELPPLEEVIKEIKEETKENKDPFYEFKKSIHMELLRLSKLGKFKPYGGLTYAVTNLKGSNWTEQFAEDLLTQLKNDDISFFIGVSNGSTTEFESGSSEDNSERSGENG